MIKVPAVGPQPAKILIIGEAPGREEELRGEPLVGTSGQEFNKMLNEAGILRRDCRITNVCLERPPQNRMDYWWPKKNSSGKQVKKYITSGMVQYDTDYFDPRVVAGIKELKEEIKRTDPHILVPLGNLPLWVVTRNSGITKWRGSILRSLPLYSERKVLPVIHPAAVLRNWEWRYLCVHDLKRANYFSRDKAYPEIKENFLVRPSFELVVSTLQDLLLRANQGAEPLYLATDIETARRHIACFGIAWSRFDAISIPFFDLPGFSDYFTLEQELQIVLLLRDLLTHRNVRAFGQNWQYDYQYVGKYWGFEVNLWMDIMTEHHVQFAGLPKGLDFQSSLYRPLHVYWKDEGKEMGGGDIDTWWTYNCRDCVATYEISEVLSGLRQTNPLRSTSEGTPNEIQQSLSLPVARMSARGVRRNHDYATRTVFMLHTDLASVETWLNRVVGRPFNPRSYPQMKKLFYEEMNLPRILDRKTHKPTLNYEALEKLSKMDVVLRPICQAVNHARSLTNYISVCLRPTDSDGRIRCQFTIPGTETYRFVSSTDPFGFGMNLQNVTYGSEEIRDWALPNLRKLFIPDLGRVMGEFDNPQADARVVAAESNDEALLELFADKSRHLHFENAALLFPGKTIKKDCLEYYYAKQGVHLTNYGGGPEVLAMTLGISISEARRFQDRWFGEHPRIRSWHDRVQVQLNTRRCVENVYGYKRFYFDRIDRLLKEALAWIPQSTVAIATNIALLRIDGDPFLRERGVQLLLQEHDSTVFQWPSERTNEVLPVMMKHARVTVPYPKPLILQAGFKSSSLSWGDCKEPTAEE